MQLRRFYTRATLLLMSVTTGDSYSYSYNLRHQSTYEGKIWALSDAEGNNLGHIQFNSFHGSLELFNSKNDEIPVGHCLAINDVGMDKQYRCEWAHTVNGETEKWNIAYFRDSRRAIVSLGQSDHDLKAGEHFLASSNLNFKPVHQYGTRNISFPASTDGVSQGSIKYDNVEKKCSLTVKTSEHADPTTVERNAFLFASIATTYVNDIARPKSTSSRGRRRHRTTFHQIDRDMELQ